MVYPRDSAKGICYERVEPDEYVVIKNISECYVDISGWVLKNRNKIYPSFTFPSCVLIPGEIIRVYTDEFNPETGGFSFYYGPGDIWSNNKPDIAVLYDAQGNEVSRKSYTVPTKINEASQ
ncbi:MAG: lamin tail domain-containing protein [Chloroflexi bacterium]|nr:lamin tail domain-containing protein [Chloroflexota bacterium]